MPIAHLFWTFGGMNFEPTQLLGRARGSGYEPGVGSSNLFGRATNFHLDQSFNIIVAAMAAKHTTGAGIAAGAPEELRKRNVLRVECQLFRQLLPCFRCVVFSSFPQTLA
jgi:hypothetical protein